MAKALYIGVLFRAVISGLLAIAFSIFHNTD